MKEWEIINALAQEMGAEHYLEIGIFEGDTFRQVNIPYKDGVDPKPVGKGKQVCNFRMTSDQFFRQHPDASYDIIFIDGLHYFGQVLQDILNSLMVLSDGGTILVHDCLPRKPSEAFHHRMTSEWMGTVWKAFAVLRMTRPDLGMWAIQVREGLGVIRPRSQEVYRVRGKCELDFAFYKANRDALMNVVSLGHFFEEVVPEWKK